MERLGDTNRDIFDVWYFFKQRWEINTEIIKKRTNLSFKDFLQKALEALEKYDDRSILAGMGDLLDNKQTAWVKIHLKGDTVFLLKNHLLMLK